MNDLRIRFIERHRKCLYEVVDIVSPLAKRACPERAQEEPVEEGSSSDRALAGRSGT